MENVAAKGNRTIGFIKRNLRECTNQVKAASYTTLVRQILEYSSTVWVPPTQSNIQTLEQIQKRAASVTLCFVQMFMSGNNDKVCKLLLKNRGYHFFNLFPMTV